MQVENRLLDDLARVASGAFGAVSGVRAEIEELLKQRFERILVDADMVPREEFEAIKAVAVKAREEQEKLEKRIAALEAAIGGKTKAKPKSRAKAKPASPKKATKRSAGKARKS
ncbi:MAG: accessory factor UbiK family protein [Alphaproteobacteria bacterium]|jgi:hypothetical protein|nr:accessory factor UbiK family protein [Alphaproteobacteria bacterium]|tara:strand:+ start:67 stop:408 length:342 start_codon:yes stop_codon:yes gene_type:complete